AYVREAGEDRRAGRVGQEQQGMSRVGERGKQPLFLVRLRVLHLRVGQTVAGADAAAPGGAVVLAVERAVRVLNRQFGQVGREVATHRGKQEEQREGAIAEELW